MTLEDIKQIDIPAEDNSVLYLWATAPKLLEALEVMKTWGFDYKTHGIWDKGWIGIEKPDNVMMRKDNLGGKGNEDSEVS